MALWIACAALATAVVAVIARPLMRSVSAAVGDTEADLAVYRDQLREIERDRVAGLLANPDADAARGEVARRLIARAEAGGRVEARSSRWGPLVYGIAALVPSAAIVIYVAVGSPGLPAQPHASRAALPPEAASVAELVGKVEARLRAAPDDGQGWDLIAPIYMRLGRPETAAEAFGHAIRLKGETAARLSGLAEATVRANNGLVTERARKAFARIAEIEPSRLDAKLWLAIAKEQDGKVGEAVADYRSILASVAADAPWREAIEQRLAAAEAKLGPKNATTPPFASQSGN